MASLHPAIKLCSKSLPLLAAIDSRCGAARKAVRFSGLHGP